MINGMIVADATAHGFNWVDDNLLLPETHSIVDGSYRFHQRFTADHPYLRLTEDEFRQDWQADQIADALFYESGIDLIGYHGTPIYDFFKDGHSANHKGFELRKEYPNRVIAYGAINPWAFDTADEIKREVDRLVDAGATGLKIYAARYIDRRTVPNPLDDEKYSFPMIERAIERGVKVIGSHKAIPIGPVRYQPYGVDDFPAACAMFPEMNFEVVHSGMAFIQETAFLAAAHKNAYFNLETSFAILTIQPRRFAEFMGALLGGGAADRIFYASGFSLSHPILALQKFLDFQMPEDLVEGFGRPQLTDEIKEKILGLNYLRMHGIDPDEFRREIAQDAVGKRQAVGLEEPWSNLRRPRPVPADPAAENADWNIPE